MSVRVTRSDDPVAAAGDELAGHLVRHLEHHEHVRLAIAGGSALKALAPALAKIGDLRSRVRMTWVDERCVPLEDPASNRGAAHRALEELLPHEELPLWLDGEEVDQALVRVRGGLADRFQNRLDITLLGMGGDGHIASLFVGGVHAGDRVIHIADSPKPPPRRMSLTRGLLATADTHVLLATGEGKRDALTRLLADDDQLPAVGLRGLSLITDLDLNAGT